MSYIRRRTVSSKQYTAALLAALALPACGDGGELSRPLQSEGDTPESQLVLARVDSALAFRVRSLKLDAAPSPSGEPKVDETFEPVIEPDRIAFTSTAEGLRPRAADGAKLAAELQLPANATDTFMVKDPVSNVALDVRLMGAAPVPAAVAKNLVVYADALGPESTVYHSVRSDGLEDFVMVPDETRSRLTYEVSMHDVAGLRLVSNTLEFLNSSGDPRLRIAPPYVVDSRGEMRWAALGVEGCSYDTDAASPWGRAVVDPANTACRVTVSWEPEGLVHPLLVDPTWTLTGNMAEKRMGHAMSKAFMEGSTQHTLVCGGLSEVGAILTSCEKRNNSTNTFAAGPAMAQPRAYFNMFNKSETCALPCACDGDRSRDRKDEVVVAGGWTAAFPFLFTATDATEIYVAGASAWVTAFPMATKRTAAAGATLGHLEYMVTGGFHQSSDVFTYHSSAEVFAWPTGDWTPAADMPEPRAYHTATALKTNRASARTNPVLVVGGHFGWGYPDRALEYDADLDQWIASQADPNLQVYSHSATQIESGRYRNQVLVAGGYRPTGVTTSAVHKYNPARGGSWEFNFDNCCTSRGWHTATLLNDKTSLIWLGGDANVSLKQHCMWTPTGKTFFEMQLERTHFASQLVRDGASWKVLAAGGYHSQGTPPGPISEAELGVP